MKNNIIDIASFIILISLKLFSEEASFGDVQIFRIDNSDILSFGYNLIDGNHGRLGGIADGAGVIPKTMEFSNDYIIC
jgi:hypothetical protein